MAHSAGPWPPHLGSDCGRAFLLNCGLSERPELLNQQKDDFAPNNAKLLEFIGFWRKKLNSLWNLVRLADGTGPTSGAWEGVVGVLSLH